MSLPAVGHLDLKLKSPPLKKKIPRFRIFERKFNFPTFFVPVKGSDSGTSLYLENFAALFGKVIGYFTEIAIISRKCRFYKCLTYFFTQEATSKIFQWGKMENH